MKSSLNVAVCQLTSTEDPIKNEEQIFNRLSLLADPKKIDIVCFPENSLFMRTSLSHRNVVTFDFTEPVFERLKEFAKANTCVLHLGSLPTKQNEKTYNTSVIINPLGEIEMPFSKIHLFDIHLEGSEPTLESAVYSHGKKPAIIEYQGWKMGFSICYDLRFSELYKFYHDNDVDIIFVPSAFLMATGKAHWELLLRARAIESQCYILAAAQGGVHDGFGSGLEKKDSERIDSEKKVSGRKSYGHSMIVDPWGDIVAEVKTLESSMVIETQIHFDKITKVRQQIPIKNHRRL